MKRTIELVVILAMASCAFAQDGAGTQGPKAGAFGLDGTMSYGESYFGVRWYATDSLYLDPYIGASIMKGSDQGSYIGCLGVKGIFEKALFPQLRAGFGLRADFRLDYETMKSGSPSERLQMDLGGGPVIALQYMIFPKLGICSDYTLLFKYVGATDMDTDEKTWSMELNTQTASLGIVFYL